MMPDTGTIRRKPPEPGDLAKEVRTLLASVGLPCAEPDAERSRAVGFAVTAADGGDAVLEWFASQSLRAAAADEQIRGIAYGHAVLAHGEARRTLNSAAYQLLEILGYRCSWTGELNVRVSGERRQDPTTLAADVQRLVAEWGSSRILAEAAEQAGREPDEPGDNERRASEQL